MEEFIGKIVTQTVWFDKTTREVRVLYSTTDDKDPGWAVQIISGPHKGRQSFMSHNEVVEQLVPRSAPQVTLPEGDALFWLFMAKLTERLAEHIAAATLELADSLISSGMYDTQGLSLGELEQRITKEVQREGRVMQALFFSARAVTSESKAQQTNEGDK